MITQTFFIHQDKDAFNRQSDGVEMCIIENFNTEKIHFYCQEYDIYWTVIDDVVDLEKSKSYEKASLCSTCTKQNYIPPHILFRFAIIVLILSFV